MKSAAPQRRHYIAVFLLSMALLQLEIAAARIMSVALFSHYAFVAVSLAMCGLGVSGLVHSPPASLHTRSPTRYPDRRRRTQSRVEL